MAQTKPGNGLLAERMLKHRMKAGELPTMDLFNPKVKHQREWSRGRVSEGIKLYLPGYIFIRFDAEVDRWQPINWTPGVSGVMYTYGEIPATISEYALSPLLGLCRDGYLIEVEADKALFKAGRDVRVVSGSWEGWRGPIKNVQGMRLKVLMHVFGRDTPVELHKRDCELVA